MNAKQTRLLKVLLVCVIAFCASVVIGGLILLDQMRVAGIEARAYAEEISGGQAVDSKTLVCLHGCGGNWFITTVTIQGAGNDRVMVVLLSNNDGNKPVIEKSPQ